MTSFTRIQQWLQEGVSLPLPPLDETGLSRAVLNNTLILHILADPNPAPDNADSLFLYVPVARTELITKQNMESVLYFVGTQNMMSALPAGFRLGLDKSSGFFWLCARFDTAHMTQIQFDETLKTCLERAEKLYTQLGEILQGAEPIAAAPKPVMTVEENINALRLKDTMNITWG